MRRSIGWKKALTLAVFLSALGGGFAMSIAVAQELKLSEPKRVIVEDVDASNYRDDRSTPQTLIASYYNAINKQEYVRAYSYYSPGGPGRGLATFTKGYEKTKSIRLALSKDADTDGGAGTLIWYQPLAIEAESEDGKKEVFGGCYTIRLVEPGAQGTLPFKPMEIERGWLVKLPLTTLEEGVPKSCDPT